MKIPKQNRAYLCNQAFYDIFETIKSWSQVFTGLRPNHQEMTISDKGAWTGRNTDPALSELELASSFWVTFLIRLPSSSR